MRAAEYRGPGTGLDQPSIGGPVTGLDKPSVGGPGTGLDQPSVGGPPQRHGGSGSVNMKTSSSSMTHVRVV